MYFEDIRYGVCNGFDNVNHLVMLIICEIMQSVAMSKSALETELGSTSRFQVLCFIEEAQLRGRTEFTLIVR